MWPLSVAVALAGPLRWERVAPAPPDARDVVFRDDGPVVRTRDGAAWALRDGGFARVAAPTELSRAADTTLVATGGHVGVLRGQPALVQWLGEGGWGDVEALPVEHATSVAREADGTLWAAGLFGTAAVRAPGGDWRPVAGVRDNLFVRVDPTGGAWFWSSAGDVLHRPDERPALPGPTPWSVAKRTLAVDARGRPVWDQGGIVRGGERLSDLDADLLAVGGEAVWARSGGATFRVADEAAVAVPFPPGKADALGATGDGGAWAVAGGHAWRVAEGEPLGLVRATSPWVRGLAGLTGPRAGDLDGDGLADLLAADAGGRLRAFRQVAGELVDHTVELVDGAPRGSASATCDLDGDGRVEVLLRGVDETGPAWRWLRARSGRLVDATAEVGLPQDDPDLARASGAATCDDLTGDGHPDLAIAGGGAVAGRVWLFANDGTGHLAPVALPARGLQVPGRHTWRLHPGDLDGDGLLDVVLATFWGEGHTVLRGAPDGWRDVSVASGLGGIYATPRASWLADVDGDDALDLVVAGTDEVRVWAGDGLRFADRTAAWGLGEADRGSHVAVLAQLDGDAHPDLVLQHPDGAWRAYTGGPGGFADRARELPALPAERASLVALDLGGDGLDLLVTTPTTAEVLHGAPRALPAATPATSPLHTRWAWTPPGVRASVAAALAAWL
ncbi:MAG: FG-GAP repeat domain-containing protein, partial [Myxococcota bacterium]